MTSDSGAPDPDVLEVRQQVAADPARVHAAWTDPAELARWWWPQLPGTTYDVDAREGGDYRIRADQVGFGVHGRFVAVEPPDRLELTWTWEDGDVDGPPERVEVSFAAHDGGTRVVVRHHLATPEAGEDYRQGWTDCLVRLADHVG